MPAVINGTNGLLQSFDYQVLTTGFSYTFAAGTQVLMLNPAATLATGTITMPASPSDGMTITVSSTKIITALTVNANTGQTINNAVTTLSAGQAVSYIYRLASTAWFPYSSDSTGSIGFGQTWQNVTGSRAVNTTYTNSTGRPIFWHVDITSSNVTPTIAGVPFQVVASVNNNTSTSAINLIVPVGATYSTAGGGITFWIELR